MERSLRPIDPSHQALASCTIERLREPETLQFNPEIIRTVQQDNRYAALESPSTASQVNGVNIQLKAIRRKPRASAW
jgi:hypothetical protein